MLVVCSDGDSISEVGKLSDLPTSFQQGSPGFEAEGTDGEVSGPA
jgi:hypothetical protein